MSAVRVEHIGNATLYLGDCRDVLPMVVGSIDAVITDPPYGVNLTGKVSHSTARNRSIKSEQFYLTYEDTPENFIQTVLPALRYALSVTKRGAVFMAERTLPSLPAWDALGGIFLPSGTGLGPWGFQSFMHCAFYGKDPFLARSLGSRPTGKYGLYANDATQVDHPCAKPVAAMLWCVERCSAPDDRVIDPFMGSGTTGVACARLGRRFIGVEMEPKYFDLACQRIAEAQRQGDLLNSAPKEDPSLMRQGVMFEEQNS
jgi:site-specific DNA-methyltransferase (adenine-specific)/modification methylase